MDKQTKEALKQLQAEIKHLQTQVAQTQVAGSRAAPPAESGPVEDAPPPAKSKSDAVVQYAIHRPGAGGGDAPFKTGTVLVSAAQIGRTTDEAAALIGYALSSPQKVALLRALLGHDGESAAALGATASLSTGSLYHHLRDLMHAGLIAQSGRNQYGITPRGQRVLLLLLALASEH